MNVDEQKKQVGEYAATLIKDNMVVGLGTGSTVKFFVDALGNRIKEENLKIIAVTTSNRTAEQASKLGINIVDINEINEIDITIDGADRVDNEFNGIKGGGAALLQEKIVAINSKKNIWIVDETKIANPLGGFPLPVEVVKYGVQQTIKNLENKLLKPTLRKTKEGEILVTDNGNYIIDLNVVTVDNPKELGEWLSQQVGIVEHGLFINIVDEVIIAGDEIKIIKK